MSDLLRIQVQLRKFESDRKLPLVEPAQEGLAAPTVPTPGQTLSPTPFRWPPGYRLNLAATLEGDQDAAIASSASPADATVGALAVLGSTGHRPRPGMGGPSPSPTRSRRG
jgi:hypothetical protein